MVLSNPYAKCEMVLLVFPWINESLHYKNHSASHIFKRIYYIVLSVTLDKLSHFRKPEMTLLTTPTLLQLVIMPLKLRSIPATTTLNSGGTLTSKISEPNLLKSNLSQAIHNIPHVNLAERALIFKNITTNQNII